MVVVIVLVSTVVHVWTPNLCSFIIMVKHQKKQSITCFCFCPPLWTHTPPYAHMLNCVCGNCLGTSSASVFNKFEGSYDTPQCDTCIQEESPS